MPTFPNMFWMALAFALADAATRTADGKLHHILFIATDDMRPEMTPYGSDYMKTPNFQQLADDGFTFRHAYVQLALCAPSRTVLLTGRRPDTSRVWTIGPYFRETTGKDWTTLPQFFKNNGWRSIGHGKIFHEGEASGAPKGVGQGQGDQDEKFGSWSEPYFHPSGNGLGFFSKSTPNPCPDTCIMEISHGSSEQSWQEFIDGHSTMKAIEWIKNASQYDEPFFLAVGFKRPHVPYSYPKEFEFTGDLKFPPENYLATVGIPPYAPHDWTGEAMRFANLWSIPNITMHDVQVDPNSLCKAAPFSTQREMKKSYLSCIQYIDHLTGKLMQALKEEGLYEQTTIIFWGDHGYKLGEHCDWFKHDNYEISTRFPLLLKPSSGVGAMQRGRVLDQLVEEIDIYPTLADLAGLNVPKELEGESQRPILEDTSLPGKENVFWQYARFWNAENKDVMGYTIRTKYYRYTEWLEWSCPIETPMGKCSDAAQVTPQWDKFLSRELYHHANLKVSGRDAFEHDSEDVNLAEMEEHAERVENLRHKLRASWPRAHGKGSTGFLSAVSSHV